MIRVDHLQPSWTFPAAEPAKMSVQATPQQPPPAQQSNQDQDNASDATDTDEEVHSLMEKAMQQQQLQQQQGPIIAPSPPPPSIARQSSSGPPIPPSSTTPSPAAIAPEPPKPPPPSTGRTSKSGTGKGSSRRPAGAITMKTLVDAGVLIPGPRVLYVDYKGSSTFADLTNAGQIHLKGMLFDSPSAFSIYIKRLVNPTRKADDGWKAVKCNGRVLETYKDDYLRMMAPSQQASEALAAAESLTGKIVATSSNQGTGDAVGLLLSPSSNNLGVDVGDMRSSVSGLPSLELATGAGLLPPQPPPKRPRASADSSRAALLPPVEVSAAHASLQGPPQPPPSMSPLPNGMIPVQNHLPHSASKGSLNNVAHSMVPVTTARGRPVRTKKPTRKRKAAEEEEHEDSTDQTVSG